MGGQRDDGEEVRNTEESRHPGVLFSVQMTPLTRFAAEGCVCQQLGPSYWLQQLSNICSLDLTDESEAGENEMREDFGIIYCSGNYAAAPQLLPPASSVSCFVRVARWNDSGGLDRQKSASKGIFFFRHTSNGSITVCWRTFSPTCCLVAFQVSITPAWWQLV